jgi:hypothetical protein
VIACVEEGRSIGSMSESRNGVVELSALEQAKGLLAEAMDVQRSEEAVSIGTIQ